LSVSDSDFSGRLLARDDAAAAAVVEERVHRFLEHPLLVTDDDLRRLQIHQTL